MPATQPLFIVQRIEWNYSDEWFYQDGDTPVKAFADRDAAERFRQEKENIARTELLSVPVSDAHAEAWSANLGDTFGELGNLTSLAEQEFRSRVIDLGLRDLPIRIHGGHDHIILYDPKWWRDAWATLAPDRTERLWNLLDNLHFFEIVKIEGPPLTDSNELHIAQIKPEFQPSAPRHESAPEHINALPVTFAFPDRASAERWARAYPPTQLNPFQEAFLDEDDESLLTVYTPDEMRGATDEEVRSVRLEELTERTLSLGLTPPDQGASSGYADDLWSDWWKATESAMTEEQRATLWRFVMPFPYDVTVIEAEGGW